MFGIDRFSAIINPPQSCIMAVGGTTTDLVLNEDTGFIDEVPNMTVTLTADHRVYDGNIANQFFDAFRRYIESPLNLLA